MKRKSANIFRDNLRLKIKVRLKLKMMSPLLAEASKVVVKGLQLSLIFQTQVLFQKVEKAHLIR